MNTTLSQWTVRDIPSQAGILAVVTGATQGIGYEVACGLAGAGAEVVIAARSRDRAEAAAARIREVHPAAIVQHETVDLSQLSSVNDFAAAMHAHGRPIQLLVNNAAVMAPPTRRVTADGFELQFQVNYLAHFALTAQLLPLLIRAGQSRVVHVTSLMYLFGRMTFDDLQSEARYRPALAYARTKLASLLFAGELHRHSAALGWGISSVSAHPGIAYTNLAANGRGEEDGLAKLNRWVGSRLAQSAGAGALPALFAATSPAAMPGGFYGPGHLFGLRGPVAQARIRADARKRDDARRLWAESEALAGVSFRAT